MASYNLVVLVGNLVRDVELKTTKSGTTVADATVAVNDRVKGADGQWTETATFVDVTLWGKTAEFASNYCRKGTSVLINGRLKLDTWEKDGQKRSKLSVVCDRLQSLTPKDQSSGGSSQQQASSQHTPGDEPPF